MGRDRRTLRRRDAIMRKINERGDELQARYEAQKIQADEDEVAAAFADAARDELGFLLELAQVLELDAIDRRLKRIAAELG